MTRELGAGDEAVEGTRKARAILKMTSMKGVSNALVAADDPAGGAVLLGQVGVGSASVPAELEEPPPELFSR